ncbi:uncharacterized protein LOC119361737 [Triticum dicoccoides]|uniref:uncharacterized protein LOC119361737 n=1 Tax=Triticum dicoccoides TaxID=85692 RepID=UPI001890609A|nr:uncharacterized protein LOC119361737 [Triticum dicoccoides]
MAPPMVLLDREIEFRPDPDLRGFWGDRGPQTRDAMTMSDQVMEYLRTFKARAVVHDPPKPSFLDILVPPLSDPLPPPYMGLDSGRISSTDKNLVALYAGGYRPGSSLPGGYLIYDACNDSLSVIPRLPDDDSQKALGHPESLGAPVGSRHVRLPRPRGRLPSRRARGSRTVPSRGLAVEVIRLRMGLAVREPSPSIQIQQLLR